MIYCNLKGGLGNMLFQIAATKSISLDLNTECCFPNLNEHLEYLNSETTYNPRLEHSSEYKLLFPNINSCKIGSNVNIVNYPFEYKNHQLNGDTLIDGFFQSEKYFKHNREKILEFINFNHIFGQHIDDKYDFIKNEKTTSIHIRRGDYLNYPNSHSIQTIDYYTKAISKLKDDTTMFIVFSDDIEWCKENLVIDNAYYVENEKDYVELCLMSLCNNNIIANSSFSWWGAWLNKNIEKKIVAPNEWFGRDIKHNTNDIIPESWFKLSNYI